MNYSSLRYVTVIAALLMFIISTSNAASHVNPGVKTIQPDFRIQCNLINLTNQNLDISIQEKLGRSLVTKPFKPHEFFTSGSIALKKFKPTFTMDYNNSERF